MPEAKLRLPRLRFPEFRDDPMWLSPQLSDLYRFKRTNNLPREKLNYKTGAVRNIHYGDIHSKFKTRFQASDEHLPFINPGVSADVLGDDGFCDEGDIVLADASEDLDGVGKAIEVVSLDGERIVAGTHTILATRRGSQPVVGFGGYLFQSSAVRAGINREAQGTKVYGISASRVSAVPIPIPSTELEQQKIADCLAALDELIEAQEDRLAVLRDHKRGLMQGLFPRLGDNTPRLRLPEFRDGGSWKLFRLGEIADSRPSLTGKNARHFKTGNARYITYKNVFSNPFTDPDILGSVQVENHENQTMVMAGDMFFTVSSETPEEVGMSSILTHDIENCYLNSFCKIYRQHEPRMLHPVFAGYYFRSTAVRKYLMRNAQGATRYNLGRDTFDNIPVLIPDIREQRRIADCLTSLDDLIRAQEDRLAVLRDHKRGLMQGLFPRKVG